MQIRHNITALKVNANRGKVQGEQAVTLERLSSGYRINRAADDAAGLGISEKLRALITGTGQAKDNVQDGISLIQAADGAMDEIHAMLNRCVEIGTQAANGVYGPDEREKMQAEIRHLTEEIDRIAKHTNFNGLHTLQGEGAIIDDGGVSVVGGLPSWVVCDPSVDEGHMVSNHTTTETGIAPDGTRVDYPIDHVSAEFDFSAYRGTAAQKAQLEGQGFYFTCCTCDNHYSIQFTSGTDQVKEQSGRHFIYKLGIDSINTAQDLVQAVTDIMENGNPNSHYTKLAPDVGNPGKLIVYDDRSSESRPPGTSGNSWPDWDNPFFGVRADDYYGRVGKGVALSSPPDPYVQPDLILQIGPKTQDILKIVLPDATTKAIGLEGLSVMSEESAQKAISAVKKGIEYLSSERGRMGAYQNRLDYTYNVLSNSDENLQSAESLIRDADMAGEMMAFVKQQILSQSTSAMLSQANKQPEAILQLLR